MNKIAVSVVLVLSLFSGNTVLAGDLDKGVRAYQGANYSTALGVLMPLAKSGDAEAQFYLGKMYLDGTGVSRDNQIGIKWLARAAKRGVPDAQYNLALTYWSGKVVPQDMRIATRWLKRAARRGHVGAQTGLGVLYLEGVYVPKSRKKAIQWLTRAAAQGNAESVVTEAIADGVERADVFETAIGAGLSALAIVDGDVTYETGVDVSRAEQALDAYSDSLAEDGTAEEVLVNVEAFSFDAGGEQASGCVGFTPTIKQKPEFRPIDYVDITPEVDIDAYVRNGDLCVQGLAWGGAYQLTVRAGVPLLTGYQTVHDYSFNVIVPDAQESVGFSGNGYILPQGPDAVLPLMTRNVDRVELVAMRIVDRNLVGRLLSALPFSRSLDQYGIVSLQSGEGELVWRGDVEIDSPRNALTRTGLPLDEIIDATQPGIYVITAHNADEDMRKWEDRPTRWVLVSDLGITSFKSPSGLTVFVNSHTTTAPISGARVVLVARNNRILGESITDINGRVDFGRGLLNGAGGAAAVGLMVYSGPTDYNVMTLSGPAMDFSDRGVVGREMPGPIDAFIYGDRGIYRPGETVHVSAIIRDETNKAITGFPANISLVRPDGETFVTSRAEEAGGGLVTASFDLPRNASTGVWRVELHADPELPALGTVSVSVEDFVPERLALELEPEREAGSPGETIRVFGNGRFLFGAPAARLEIEAELIIEHDPKPYSEFGGYSFGLITDEWVAHRTELKPAITNAHGLATLDVLLPEVADTTLPLRARLVATLFEPGGRGLTRSASISLRPRDMAIGIRPQFEKVGSGQSVSFDVVALDMKGKQVAGKSLSWVLIRENRRYHWEQVGGNWQYRVSIHPTVIENGRFITSQSPVSLSAEVDWGSYRLEVYDSQTGAATSHRFSAGWWLVAEEADTPDRVLVALDADSYSPGSMARIRIDPPYAGTALVSVLGNSVLETLRVPVSEDGTEVALKVKDDWGIAGAYVSVTLLREGKYDRAPGRAIGITWVQIDRSDRTLSIDIDVPDKVRPNQDLEVPIQLVGLPQGESAWVTLSAVDQGILSLTDYRTPDPAKHFYGQRSLATELRDTYGRLIDPRYDRLGRLRSGGDSMARQNTGLEIDAYESVAIFSGPLKVDRAGQVMIPVNLPDFNGALRLMAVATSLGKVGSGQADITVRSPLVAELSRPRFMAPGDIANLQLGLHNLDADPGVTLVSLSATGAISVTPSKIKVNLEVGEKSFSQVRLKADEAGLGKVKLRLTGPGELSVERSFDIAVRPAQAVSSERRIVRLPPGESLTAGFNMVKDFLPETSRLSIVVGAGPTFNLPRLISSLSRYPYGCLEQTVSKTMPLLYLPSLAQYAGVKTDVTELYTTAQRGIQHLVTMQKSDGSFGLWSSYDRTEPWLTVYAFDFMTRARAEGFVVPDTVYDKTKRWLETDLIKRGRDLFGLRAADAARPYALYALARAGAPDVSALRYWTVRKESQRSNVETAAYLAAGLLTGQVTPTQFREAGNPGYIIRQLNQSREWHAYDYGSTLRDAAMQLVLLSEAGLDDVFMFELADRIENMMSARTELSTQEKSWLTLAGKSMIERYGSIEVAIDGKEQRSNKPLIVSMITTDIQKGVSIENQGDTSIAITVLGSGVPIMPLPAEEQGFVVGRTIYRLDGTETANGEGLQQGDRFVIVLEGHTETDSEQQALLVDLLPAGLEIENTRLIHGGSLDDFSWIGRVSNHAHMEMRDDRFVSAINLDYRLETFRIAYLVRAVTPGHYVWPAVYAEDMYRPDRFARGAIEMLEVIARR